MERNIGVMLRVWIPLSLLFVLWQLLQEQGRYPTPFTCSTTEIGKQCPICGLHCRNIKCACEFTVKEMEYAYSETGKSGEEASQMLVKVVRHPLEMGSCLELNVLAS